MSNASLARPHPLIVLPNRRLCATAIRGPPRPRTQSLYVPNPRSLSSAENDAVIPYTRTFRSAAHIQLHARITALAPHCATLSTPFAEHGLSDVLHFDYAVYALGSHLPSPINLWGAPPPVKGAAAATAPYAGTKAESVAWLQQHQAAVEAASTVLVVGGGALGIRESLRVFREKNAHGGARIRDRHRGGASWQAGDAAALAAPAPPALRPRDAL